MSLCLLGDLFFSLSLLLSFALSLSLSDLDFPFDCQENVDYLEKHKLCVNHAKCTFL